MSPATPFSRLSEPDQWRRCHHDGTSLLDGGRGIELAWSEPPAHPEVSRVQAAPAGGLAEDRWGRVYRSEPDAGRVVVLPRSPSGATASPASGVLDQPRGLAVDAAQRLYVAEPGRSRVLVVDLWAQRLVCAVATTRGDGRPVDVAADGYGVLALLDGPPGLVTIRGRRGPIPAGTPRPPHPALRPARLVRHPTAGVLVLWRDPDSQTAFVCDVDGLRALEVPDATDLEVDGRDALVVARAPGLSFRAWADRSAAWVGLEPLDATGYDGSAIARDATGTIAYTTDRGVARSAGSAATYGSTGRLLTYRLDAGTYRARWGRVFVDACLPPGTAIRLEAISSDEDEVLDPPPPRAPVHDAGSVPFPDLTPPLPPAEPLARLPRPLTRPIYRRSTGSETPWEQVADDDRYDTFETTVDAQPGRYVWLVVDLLGSASASPRIREMRVEQSGHRLDRQLPRSWSRDETDASFLHRFLAPAEGMLRDLDARAAHRASLLDPDSTSPEALDWLGSFWGLVQDRRWSLAARRELVAQAYDLYRLRGTQAALERMLGIYLEREVDIVENWRLRGLGGTTLGQPASGRRPPFVAEAGRAVEPLGSFVVGGPLPHATDTIALSDSDTAHRFTVIVPVPLSAEQRAVVTSIIETHKPAHTRADLCELGDGMRIGQVRVDLTSFVGSSSGWGPDIVGQVLLGTDGVVGIPDVAARVGDTAMGRVRVG